MKNVLLVARTLNTPKTLLLINALAIFKVQVSFVKSAIRNCIPKGRLALTKSLYDYCIEHDNFLLLSQWDKEKNGDLTAHDVSYGSHKKVWWRCNSDHSWETPVYSRTTSSSGCPYCTGKKLPQYSKTLASEYPLLLKEWHPTLNTDVSPDNLAPSTHRKVWWRCSKGHVWKAQVKSRVSGTGCPICNNRKVELGENDLATTHPEIAAQWHPTKNGSRTPQSVVCGHHAKVWWQCEKGHEWQATIISRTFNGNGCPVCAGKVVIAGVNDLASANPTVATQWHPTKNGTLTPEQVTPFSNRKAWWICDKGHEYYSVIAHKVQNSSGCPYCTNRKVLAGFNDLATLEPEIAAQWHPILNGELTPQMVTVGSHKRIWWQCSEGHSWKAVIYSRTGSRKHGCPVCVGRVNAVKKWRYEEIMMNSKITTHRKNGNAD